MIRHDMRGFWRRFIAPGSNSSQMAFTKIELIVAISVVGLLAAIFIAAFYKREEKKNRIVCADNIRQIGIALHQYAEENQRQLPDCTTNNPKFYGSWWPWDLNTNLVTELEQRGGLNPV